MSEQTKQEKRMSRTRTSLVLDHPWWGHLSMRLMMRETTKIPTMATDGTRLLYNPNFIDTLTDDELKGVVAHEVQHCALRHMYRMGDRDIALYNQACDLYINPVLKACGFTLPKDHLHDPQFEGEEWYVEKIYAVLAQRKHEAKMAAEAALKKIQQQIQIQEKHKQKAPKQKSDQDDDSDGEENEEKSQGGSDEGDDNDTESGGGNGNDKESEDDDTDSDDDSDPSGSGEDDSDEDGEDEESEEGDEDDADGDGSGSDDDDDSDEETDSDGEQDYKDCATGCFQRPPKQKELDADEEDGKGIRPMSDCDWESAVVNVSQIAKRAGKLPANLEGQIEQSREEITNVWECLRKFIEKTAPIDFSWAIPNRRHVARGQYLPGVHKENMPRFVIAFDTSGSMFCGAARQLLNEAAMHLTHILHEFRPEAIDIVYCDCQVQKVEIFYPDDPEVKINFPGGGGTAFQPVFDWLETREDVSPPSCLVYFTDLEGPAPIQPEYPVLWITTEMTNENAWFGETIRLPHPDHHKNYQEVY